MDLDSITEVVAPRARDMLPPWRPGDAWLAGGTWLFSEPQDGIARLVDLPSLGWEPLAVDASGLRIAATCTIAALDRLVLPPPFRAAPLIGQCCRALLGSFKVWNAATVGGNLCLALPAGPMIALTVALDGTGLIWTPDGGERRLPIRDLVLGPQETALGPARSCAGSTCRRRRSPAARPSGACRSAPTAARARSRSPPWIRRVPSPSR